MRLLHLLYFPKAVAARCHPAGQHILAHAEEGLVVGLTVPGLTVTSVLAVAGNCCDSPTEQAAVGVSSHERISLGTK